MENNNSLQIDILHESKITRTNAKEIMMYKFGGTKLMRSNTTFLAQFHKMQLNYQSYVRFSWDSGIAINHNVATFNSLTFVHTDQRVQCKNM